MYKRHVSQDILGCTFTLEHRQTGETLFEVGQGPDSAGTNLALMMLKPRNSHPNHSTWPLMFKNVNSKGSNIDQNGLEIEIVLDESAYNQLTHSQSGKSYLNVNILDSIITIIMTIIKKIFF